MKLSLLLPVYHPPAMWVTPVMRCALELLQNEGISEVEVVMVDDGNERPVFDVFSIQENVERISFVRISNHNNYGKGYSLRRAAAAATGHICIYTDVDLPYTMESMQELLQALRSGNCDIAMGVKDSEYYRHLPAFRVTISKFLRWCSTRVLHLPTNDTQCGLKGFNEAGKQVFLQTTINRYLFDLEFILMAAKKLRIKTIEVHLREGVTFHRMSTKVLLQEGFNFLKLLFKR
ncbi:MAG: glycosyltransferase [Chitinophagales bacterium]